MVMHVLGYLSHTAYVQTLSTLHNQLAFNSVSAISYTLDKRKAGAAPEVTCSK